MDALTRQLASMYRQEILADYAEHWATPRHLTDRCRHGTFIGDPYGPDYGCGSCEMGAYCEEQEALIFALAAAKVNVQHMKERSAAVQTLKTLNAPLDIDTFKVLGEWIWDSIAREFDRLTARHVARTAQRAGWRSQFHPPTPAEPSHEDREAQAHYDDTTRR